MKLSILLFFGYPPLIVYLVSVILYNSDKYKFSKDGIFVNGIVIYLIVPQYLLCIVFMLFHLFVAIPQRAWTITILNIFSSVYATLAGSSLFLIRIMTSNFEFSNDKGRILIGLLLLTVLQLLGYTIWPHSARKRAESQTFRRWRPTQRFCNTRCVMWFLFGLFAVFGFLSFLLYSASVVSNGIALRFSYKSILTIKKQIYLFDSVVIHLPILMYPAILSLQILFLNFKKIWLDQITCLLKSLLNISLGYIIFMMLWYLFRFYIHLSFGLPNSGPDPELLLNSMILLLCTAIALSLSIVCMSLPWSYIFRNHIMFRTETPLLLEETQPLIHSTRDY